MSHRAIRFRLPTAGLAIAGVVLLILGSSAASAADRFYEDLLRQGVEAQEHGDPAAAAKLLRLACFGLLEEPPALARCLTHLALAQAGLDDTAAFNTTFGRILEIEQRFQAYSKAALSPALRRAFESQLAQRTPAELLERSPVFRALAQRLSEETADVELREDEAGKESPDPRSAGRTDAGREPAAMTSPSEGDVRAAEAPAPGSPASSELSESLARARQRLRSGSRDELVQELARLRPLADRHSDDREAQHTVAELAYRVGSWQLSRTYFERGGEVDPSQSIMLFYSAVVLYETGDRELAAAALEKCLPRLRRTPYVEEYVRKILGER